jgi:prolyl-tRNA editing enzyme YbaK/EbsC (Cys-tRNA(Pro) deacylase)
MSTSRTAEKKDEGGGSGSLARVVADARRLGLDIEPVRLAAGTRTAEEAARACGCGLDQIVKSIVFRVSGRGAACAVPDRRGQSGRSGDKAAALVGAPLEKADAGSVRAETGFAIGGVAPIGHLTPIETFSIRACSTSGPVWAAAGTPSHVFASRPAAGGGAASR